MLLVNAVGSTQMHRLRVYLVFCVRQKVVKLQSPHTPLKPLHRIILNRIKEVGFPRRAETHRRHHSELILQLERYTRKRHDDDGGISLFSRKSLRLQTAEKYCCKCFVRSLAVVFGRVPEHTASEQTKRKEILRYRIATEAVIKPSTQKAFEQFLIFSLSLSISHALCLLWYKIIWFSYTPNTFGSQHMDSARRPRGSIELQKVYLSKCDASPPSPPRTTGLNIYIPSFGLSIRPPIDLFVFDGDKRDAVPPAQYRYAFCVFEIRQRYAKVSIALQVGGKLMHAFTFESNNGNL